MPLQYIDTRIGTENTSTFSNGNCLPYTGVPFGMNYFGVQNGEGSWWFSPSKPLFCWIPSNTSTQSMDG